MSFKDGEMHAFAGLISLAITAALTAGAHYMQGGGPPEICDDSAAVDEDKDGHANCDDDDCSELPLCADKRLVIDAELAYKKEEVKQQPQKQLEEKEKKLEPEGVSRDDKKKPDDKSCKTNADCGAKEECIKNVCTRRKNDQTAETDPLGKIPDRTNVDDLPSGSATPQIGAFDGSKHGHGDVTRGDPYFGRMNADLKNLYQPPAIASESGDPPEGCVRIMPDGKISELKFTKRSSDDRMPLAEKALADLQRKRNQDPEPVPTHLLEALTTQWICFKFTVKSPD